MHDGKEKNVGSTPLSTIASASGNSLDRYAVETTSLHFAYTAGEDILHDIDLTVRPGELWAIIGPNGGGKTTLLRLLLGLLTPKSGSISIFGQKPEVMNANIGYVPQFSTLQADFPARVLDVVLMGAAQKNLRGGSWSKDRKSVDKAVYYLETLGLQNCIKQYVGALSGGQRQRALVARALMSKNDTADATNSPFLLLLDEPTASVDPQGKFCFYEFLGKLRGEITIIVVSHDLFIASPFFDKVAFINREATFLQDATLSPEQLTLLFGQHHHECPVADMQHAEGVHHDDCSHPACRTGAVGKNMQGNSSAKADSCCQPETRDV